MSSGTSSWTYVGVTLFNRTMEIVQGEYWQKYFFFITDPNITVVDKERYVEERRRWKTIT